MTYTVRGGDIDGFSVMPESAVEEVLQNVRLLLASHRYDIPLARDMGIDTDYLHKPQNVAENLLYQSIMDVIEQYEPRAAVSSIDFEADALSGILIPILEVEINE